MRKKNKKFIYIGLIVLMNIAVIYLIVKALGNGVDKNREVVAYVDSKPIYREDIQYRLDAFLENAKMNKNEVKLEQFPENFIKAVALEVFVTQKLDKIAKKDGYNKNKEIRELVDTYEKKLMREKFIKEKIMSSIDEESVQKRYAELTASLEGKEERKVRHILVKDEEEARRVRRNVLRTGNFERYALQKSIDKSTAENGGDLGYILKEEMVPEFGDVAFLLKKGELSRPVKTQFGWHILKVEDIRDAKPLPFDQVKNDIQSRLQQEALQNYLKDFTKDAEIEMMIKNEKINTKEEEKKEIENNDVEDLEEDNQNEESEL